MTKTPTKKPAAQPETGSRKTPFGFRIHDGSYYVADDKGDQEWLVCGPIEAQIGARTPQGKQWEFHFRFPDLDGVVRTVKVLRKDLASDPRAVAALFGDVGLPTGDSAPSWALPQLLKFLANQLPSNRRGTLVECPGFHELPNGEWAFATPDGRTLRAGDDPEGPIFVLADPTGPQLGGTLEGMRKVADAVVRTRLDHLIAGLLMGVAGVVVDFAELPSSPIIALVGSTSSGKTTTLYIAASMTGPHMGPGSRFGTLATTLNAVEARFAAANGTFFGGDETALFPRDKLQEFVFSGASGEGKGRARTDASVRPVRRWKTFAGLTSEVPLRELMRGPDKREPRAGAAVRAASIDTSDARRLDEDELKRVKGFETHYGHALEPVVRILLRSTLSDPNARARVRAEIAERAATLAGSDADSLTVRSAAVFAVLGVSGRLLHEAGITPADFDADALTARLWAAFHASSEAPADPVETAAQRLTEKLYTGLSGRIVLTSDAVAERPFTPQAYYQTRGEKLLFFVPLDNVDEMTGGGVGKETVAKLLRDQGLLETPEQRGRLLSRRIPGVGSISHYRIVLPRPEAAEDPASALISALNPVSGTDNVVEVGAGARRLLM